MILKSVLHCRKFNLNSNFIKWFLDTTLSSLKMRIKISKEEKVGQGFHFKKTNGDVRARPFSHPKSPEQFSIVKRVFSDMTIFLYNF